VNQICEIICIIFVCIIDMPQFSIMFALLARTLRAAVAVATASGLFETDW